MTFEEKTLSSERIYEGTILNLRKDKVLVAGGTTSYREIVEHRGGVALAAVTDDKKMVLVRQFRKAAGKVILEVPAGKIENGEKEEPRLTAIRELKEETGYTASKIEHITSFYSSVGYSEEVIHLYYATGLVPGETEFDAHEALDIVEYDIAELKQMVLDGKIEDAKTIAAIMIVAVKEGI
ncbi:MAG TPA: NUDIX hydrolase [Bacillota bacterium]|jgi:ADP-ribose pyrophosphatase|nr:ADP-ribose pyrophosphatase [Clostridiales bacterium UBA9856]HOA42961.1 NUDIX hydrolase [Bacillota bacterium]HPZ59643.1 NUDIX hydrolase [Bacillota bacterium]HQC81835.1 NUDIX hydrolase [Bacillota bacterium]